ncbi:MAG: hypothetical protein RR565_07550 [Erysipelothrix sp.]
MKTKTNAQLFFNLTGVLIILIKWYLESVLEPSNIWLIAYNWVLYIYLFILICLIFKDIIDRRKKKKE